MWTLSKCYQDCVTASGDTFIAYWARLNIGRVTIPCSAFLTKTGDDPIRSGFSFCKVAEPELSGKQINWNWPKQKIQASWKSRGIPAIRRTLHKDPKGKVQWNCLLPQANVQVKMGDQFLSGLGYMEQLEISMTPWNIPIHELRWGRFVSAEHSITWIDWRGPVERHWIFYNGIEQQASRVLDNRIELKEKNSVLDLDNITVLRSGPLKKTILRTSSILNCVLSRNVLNTHETKWLTRGTLVTPQATYTGWVINEVVRWT